VGARIAAHRSVLAHDPLALCRVLRDGGAKWDDKHEQEH
jgi:hypothetical protein